MTETSFPVIDFFASPIGSALVTTGSVFLCGYGIWWAMRPSEPNRFNLLIGATGATLLLALISLIAFLAGWWSGPYYDRIPLITHIAISLPLSLVAWMIWMLLYRWLEQKSRNAFIVYMVGMLIFIPITDIVDRLNIERGVITLGGGYTILSDIILGLIVMWSPVLCYEWSKKRRDREKISSEIQS